MSGTAFERYLLLERSGNGKSNTSVFEMRLHGKKLHIRHGNKGQKLAKKIYKKHSITEAMSLFSDKRKQKMKDGYRIIKEENKNKPKNKQNASLNAALPISGKSIVNPNANHRNNHHPQNAHKLAKIRQQLKQLNVTNVPQQQAPHSDEESAISQGRLKRGNPLRQNKHRKGKQKHRFKQKHGRGGKKHNNKRQKHNRQRPQKAKQSPNPYNADTESSASATPYDDDDDEENNSQIVNGNHHAMNGHDYHGESEFNSAINSEEEDEESEQEESEEEEDEESGSSEASSSSSVQSGRSSDNEYEMDYEKMSHVMNDALNAEIDEDELEWKPLKVWIRYNEYHDKRGEYAMATQVKRIAGSCHELMVVYMRSSSFEHEKGIIYKRLLKLARDPEEDNKHHFDTERNVSQYLSRMALMINNTFVSRSDVCIWPVETVQFEYNGELKWATIQPPFLPKPRTNNVFVKIEPNSGKPCVMDATVGRYQHLFASITRGLDLIRDWQGYGVSQDTFLDVCRTFHVQKEAITQIKVRKNSRLQKQTQVLVVIDPVLTTYNAHYETNNPTDFGVKAIDEWKAHHDCIRCRCKHAHLLSTQCTEENKEGMQFGIADIDQSFFNQNTIPKHMAQEIAKCRYDLNIWCGDDYFDEDNKENENDTQQ
eukprot:252860_1